MPIINGYEFALKLSSLQDEQDYKIPLISYSSTSMNSTELKKQISFGFDDYLEKPAPMYKLKEKL